VFHKNLHFIVENKPVP